MHYVFSICLSYYQIVGAATPNVEKSEPVRVGKSGIEIKILAKPGAKCNSITGT